MNSSKAMAIAALLIILGLGGLRDTLLLVKNNVAVGVDGYYYVLQIEALRNHHRPYFSTPTPFILYLLTGISYFESDAIKAVKIGSVLLHALLSLGVFALIASTIRKVWLGVLGSALAVIPQAHFYLISEFINQLGALTLVIWAGWFAIRAKQAREKPLLRRVSVGGAIILLIAAFVSHRSAIVIAITIAVFGFLVVAFSRTGVWTAVALATTVLIWLSPAIISVQTLIDVPTWLQNQVSSRPHWPFGGLLLGPTLMLMIASVAVLFLAFKSIRKVGATTWNVAFGPAVLLSLLIILNPFLNPEIGLSGVAVRLRVLSYVGAALLVPASISVAYLRRREVAIYLGAVFLPFLILSALAPLPYGLWPEFLARREQLIQALKIHSSALTPNSIVIAPHGDQFVVTATIRVPSQQRLPQNSQYDKIYWLLDDVTDRTLINDSIVLFENQAAATILAEDRVFKGHLDAMTALDKNRLIRTNPHVARSFSLTLDGSTP